MSETTQPRKAVSEDGPGEKWDRCIADTMIKTGTGLGLGLVFSLLLFKRRPWPVALGTGFGLGYAMSNCQHDFRRVQSVYLRPIEVHPVPAPSLESPSDKPESQASESETKNGPSTEKDS